MCGPFPRLGIFNDAHGVVLWQAKSKFEVFLAHWFQLGKPVVLAGDRDECLPCPVYYKNGYSQSFEECWQRIMESRGEGCYLKGTTQTVAEMMTSGWEVTPLRPLRDARRRTHPGHNEVSLPLP